MCGIAGILSFNNKEIQEASLKKINDALAHRGPDAEGFWYNNNKTVGFGHRRLSILDLSESANLPMQYNNRYWITYNGEIFNFLELRLELEKKGYTFNTNTDTEVILAAYSEWGEDMQNKFNGMWAFAIYDTKKHQLFLSRDRYGIKPLYYYKTDSILVFASEVQAIHKYLGNSHKLNSQVMQNIAIGGFESFAINETYLENVYALPSGCSLSVLDKKVNIKRWYSLPIKKIKADSEILKNLITDACNIRLRSDVAVGTCLSGGVDSGSITSIISKLKNTGNTYYKNYSHKSFCAAFPNTHIDESKDAKYVANKVGSMLDVVNIESPTVKELEEAMSLSDGPMHALAFFPIWKLYKHIKKQGITVTLDGQGPDEMLGGYSPLLEALETAWQKFDIPWFFDVYKTYSSQGESKQASSKKRSKRILINFIRNKLLYLPKYLLSLINLYDLDKIKYNNSLQKQYALNPPNELDFFSKSLFNQFFNSPLPAILQQYDRCSMANSVECRMPFMDYRIVEYIFNINSKEKVGNGYTKKILRESMEGILPDRIRLNKTKIGFNAPIVDWFRGELKDWMLEQMNTFEFVNNTFFDGNKIKNDFIKFLKKDNPQWNEAWRFWPPVHIAWWIRRNGIKV